jgi:predicted flap endonuclease-1-like 5' DNA nuclease
MFLVTLLFLIAIVVAALAGYAIAIRGRATRMSPGEPRPALASIPPLPRQVSDNAGNDDIEVERIGMEKARIIRSRDDEAAMLRRRLAKCESRAVRHVESESGRDQAMAAELAAARQESARYRQLVIDIENKAPPPILSGVGEPDDLKLIVGIGPVLERMLHNLGVTTFRQIARWSERDSAEFDARLPEFPGRIVRDQWVTQARELHQAKFGEPPSDRPPRL